MIDKDKLQATTLGCRKKLIGIAMHRIADLRREERHVFNFYAEDARQILEHIETIERELNQKTAELEALHKSHEHNLSVTLDLMTENAQLKRELNELQYRYEAQVAISLGLSNENHRLKYATVKSGGTV